MILLTFEMFLMDYLHVCDVLWDNRRQRQTLSLCRFMNVFASNVHGDGPVGRTLTDDYQTWVRYPPQVLHTGVFVMNECVSGLAFTAISTGKFMATSTCELRRFQLANCDDFHLRIYDNFNLRFSI